jgi:hypothetical protein
MRYLALCFCMLFSTFLSAATLNIQEFNFVDTEYILPGTPKSIFSFVASPNGTATFNYVELIEANDEDLSSVINTVELRVSPNTEITSSTCTTSTSKIVCSGFSEELTDKETYRFNIDYLTTDVETYTYKIGSANVTGFPTEESVSVSVTLLENAIVPIALRYKGDTNETIKSGVTFESGESQVFAGEGHLDVPVASFTLKAVNATLNIKEFIFSNSKETFDFEEGVSKVTIYADTATDNVSFGYKEIVAGPIGVQSIAAHTSEKELVTIAIENDLIIPKGEDSNRFYVFYDFSSSSGGKEVDFDISSVVASFNSDLNVGVSTLNITTSASPEPKDADMAIAIGDNPSIEFEGVSQLLENKTFGALSDPLPDNQFMAGMYNIEFFSVTVDVSEAITSMNIHLKSLDQAFSTTGEGIVKVSVYNDTNGTTINKIDAEDTFLLGQSMDVDDSENITLSGLSLSLGTQRLLLVVELGQQSNGVFSFFIDKVTFSGDSTNTVSLVTPFPQQAVTRNVSAHVLDITAIEDNATTVTSNFTVDVTLSSSDAVSVSKNSTLKFYEGDIKGVDASYQFDILTEAVPLDLSASSTSTLQHQVTSKVVSDASYVIDYDAYYTLDDADYYDYSIRLTRHNGQGEQIVSALALGTGSDLGALSAVSTHTNYIGFLPEYIASVNYVVSGTSMAFNNYQAVKPAAKIQISFYNQGLDIDPKSVEYVVDPGDFSSGETNALVQSSIDSFFVKPQVVSSFAENSVDVEAVYNPAVGMLTITLPDEMSGQGSITVSAKDNLGNLYPTGVLSFFSNTELAVNQFRVYPNPYSPSVHETQLSFGVALTKPAFIDLYIYDASGRQVTRFEQAKYCSDEYCLIEPESVDVRSKAFASGTYFIKLIVTDDNGDQVQTSTKLAVY